jgi:hypothetical protein
MREKTKVIESTQGLGNDLAGVLALQRKLAGTERDLEAIAAGQMPWLLVIHPKPLPSMPGLEKCKLAGRTCEPP